MIIKEMPWEKRNLGVDAISFRVLPEDRAKDIIPQIIDCCAEYQEMRVPSGNTDVLLAVQEHGFRIIEMSIELQIGFVKGQSQTQGMFDRFRPYASFSFASNEEYTRILEAIETGDMFKTDKISRNPRFGKELAGRRYANWLKEEKENGATIVNVELKGEKIGFLSYVDLGKDVYDVFLAGIFPKYDNRGMGVVLDGVNNLVLKELGAKKAMTHVSSNNLPNLKCLLVNGNTITNMEYVLMRSVDISK